MKSTPVAVLLWLILLLAGCQAPRRIVPAEGSPQPSQTIAGEVWLVSPPPGSVAVRCLTPEMSRLASPPGFAIRVTNHGASDLVFSLRDVSATSGANPVRLYSPAERAAQVERSVRLETLSIEARRRQETIRSEQRPLARAGSTDALPSPAPALAAQEATLRLNQAAAVARAGVASMLDRLVVPPGGSGGGLVMIHAEDLAANQPLVLRVRFAGETSTFHFAVAPGRAFVDAPVR